MTRARVGVIGAGWWSTRAHLPSLAAYERAEVTAIMDLDASRARRAADRFGIDHAVTDLEQFFGLGLDVVVIATPHETHYELARAALLAGCDVLVEKPMVVVPAHGRDLVDLAARRDLRLHVGYPYPHARHARRLRTAVRRGELGELQLVTSLFATSAGVLYDGGEPLDDPDALVGPDPATYSSPGLGGQALTQLTHSASLMLHVTGIHPVEVAAFTSDGGLGVDMVDVATFRADGETLGTMASTGSVALTATAVEHLIVFGTSGKALLDTVNGTLTIHHYGAEPEVAPPAVGEDRYPERTTARHLVDCFLDGTEPLVDGELGSQTAELIDGILRSAGQRRPVSLAAAELEGGAA